MLVWSGRAPNPELLCRFALDYSNITFEFDLVNHKAYQSRIYSTVRTLLPVEVI